MHAGQDASSGTGHCTARGSVGAGGASFHRQRMGRSLWDLQGNGSCAAQQNPNRTHIPSCRCARLQTTVRKAYNEHPPSVNWPTQLTRQTGLWIGYLCMPCLVGQSLEGVLKVLSFRVLTILGNVAGVAWLSKRWSRTHVMIFMITKLQARALANAVSCSCSVPTQVQDMTLVLDEDPHTCMMWMAWLLAHMPRLRYLKLTIWDHQLSWVPPLMQLQHLELKYDTSTDASMAELLLLTNLRTLSLCENYGLDVLDLRMLPKLQCARLYVSCKKLWVAEQCRVYLELSEVNFTNSHDWSDALGSVRSVAWTTEGTRIGQQLPALLMQAHNLSWVDLVCGDVGSADAPVVLVGTLSHLARLNIRASTIHMQLPASLALDRLMHSMSFT